MHTIRIAHLLASFLLAHAIATTIASAQSTQPATQLAFPVNITVDLADRIGPYKQIHRFFGCDEPNYAYMPTGKRLLEALGNTSSDEPVYFRTHSLFCTGDGTPALKWGSTNIYTEDANGNPIYDFKIFDRIFDAYREAGVKPYFQLGFMPKALSTHPEPYQHSWAPGKPYNDIYTGWAYPPKDYQKWSELCYRVTRHCVERYGKEQVEQWYFETWNEPNIGYWKGTPEEFLKLHDFAIAGVKRALPTARVGGPDSAGDGGAFREAFLDHCINGTNFATGEKGTPLDFVSFHAKGSPAFVENHVRMGIAAQLKTVDKAFTAIAARAQTKALPIVIGESDPEGCAACTGPQMAYRNGTMYSSYTAAVFARKLQLADEHGVNLEGAVTWAFEFENQPLFAGFRVLASGEIDHAVLNVFRFLGKMDGDRIRATSDGAIDLKEMISKGVRDKPDVAALATTSANQAYALVWHYHDDDLPGPDASVTLAFNHLPAGAMNAVLSEYRIDQSHGNAFPLWLSMGSPQNPTDAQLAKLKEAATTTLLRSEVPVSINNQSGSVSIDLPRQGVSLVVLSWTIPAP